MHATFHAKSLAVALLTGLVVAPPCAWSQNAAQMEYERQQREYWRAQEQAREADRQRQQLMNENARRSQGEPGPANSVPMGGQGYQPAAPGGTAGGGAAGPGARSVWQRRPPLAPERNRLLGRWNPQGAAAGGPKELAGGGDLAKLFGPDAAKMTAALLGGMTQGACDSMFGRGIVEFRPKTLVAIGRDGSESVMNHVEYRGGGSRVVVLPQDPGSIGALIFDFDSPDHITAAALGCVMARAGSAATTAGAAQAGDARGGVVGGAGGAILALEAGVAERPGQVTPVVGRDMWVLRGSADMALIRGGLQSTPDGSVMHNFWLACQRRTPDCQKGMQAIRASSVSLVQTDARGHAQTAALPAGRYYVFGTLVFNQRPMIWHVPIDLRAGSNSLALNLSNASSVE